MPKIINLPEMARIPSGTFLMGSSRDELGHKATESPQQEVIVPSFLLGKYPVTQYQWVDVATWLPPVNRELNPNPSRFKGGYRPVEQVSWFEAVEFCDRLSQYTGKVFRLPTEAEHEYACRAGTKAPFHYGNSLTPRTASYDSDSTARVGKFPANRFGLHDMHGNVWEWCQDHWHPNYEGAPTNGSAWVDMGEDYARVLRGGSWLDDPEGCRSASRFFNMEASVSSIQGFRVACDG